VGTKWSAMFSGIEKYLEEKPWKFRSVYIIVILSEVELTQDAILSNKKVWNSRAIFLDF
jgi:hypothetical protein